MSRPYYTSDGKIYAPNKARWIEFIKYWPEASHMEGPGVCMIKIMPGDIRFPAKGPSRTQERPYRKFSDSFVWSEDSEQLAIVEWNQQKETLVVFHFTRFKEAVIPINREGEDLWLHTFERNVITATLDGKQFEISLEKVPSSEWKRMQTESTE